MAATAGHGEVQRLLAGAALAVHGDAEDASGQPAVSTAVRAMWTGPASPACMTRTQIDVVDEAQDIDPGALHKPVEDLRRQFGRGNAPNNWRRYAYRLVDGTSSTMTASPWTSPSKMGYGSSLATHAISELRARQHYERKSQGALGQPTSW